MISTEQIAKLRVVSYPDPILRKVCAPIETFGPQWQQIAERMLDLMHAHRGVGLAGPQVGLPWRIFVWNPTGQEEDDHVFINPELSRLSGQAVAEEGCLSIEGVNVNVQRAVTADVDAHLPDGSTVKLRGEGLVARIWQHETDHLNGRLILDYMSAADEIANRRAVKDLEAKYKAQHKGAARRAKKRAGR
ncbi:MAG TPA: peptide deformylase [Phycisphaerae bacterium]|nr:peptide deformylase [Phycisphaerae bacterium]